jgi:hypothetical protein
MICSFQENAKYRKFRDSPMENLDELEVMFQHINVTGASSVIPRGRPSQRSIDVSDDSYEAEEDVTATANENEKKRKERGRLRMLFLVEGRRLEIQWLGKCHG